MKEKHFHTEVCVLLMNASTHYKNLEASVKEKHFHTEVCVLIMNASTHSQNLEANYELYKYIKKH